MDLKDRFLKYVSFDTQSDEMSETFPSTEKQKVLLKYLVEEMKDVNPQKLHQEICGLNKKHKLELTNPSVNDVTEWIQKIN